MKINVFKKAFNSFLLVASLTFGCFQLSSCSSNDDIDNVLTHSYQEEMWEKVTGLSYSDISKVNLFGCSKPAYLPYKNQDFTTNDKYAYTFYGIKTKNFGLLHTSQMFFLRTIWITKMDIIKYLNGPTLKILILTNASVNIQP